MSISNWGQSWTSDQLPALHELQQWFWLTRQYKCRCIFCGWYGLRIRDLIDHWVGQHGAVV